MGRAIGWDGPAADAALLARLRRRVTELEADLHQQQEEYRAACEELARVQQEQAERLTALENIIEDKLRRDEFAHKEVDRLSRMLPEPPLDSEGMMTHTHMGVCKKGRRHVPPCEFGGGV